VRVLLVEDDVLTKKVISTMLDKCGYEVLEAHNGREAMQVIEAEAGNVDVVLTDVLMPEVSGFELLINILQQPQYAHISIVLMSSSSGEDVRARAAEAGAAGFLSKPVRREDVSEFRRHVARDRRASHGGSGTSEGRAHHGATSTRRHSLALDRPAGGADPGHRRRSLALGAPLAPGAPPGADAPLPRALLELSMIGAERERIQAEHAAAEAAPAPAASPAPGQPHDGAAGLNHSDQRSAFQSFQPGPFAALVPRPVPRAPASAGLPGIGTGAGGAFGAPSLFRPAGVAPAPAAPPPLSPGAALPLFKGLEGLASAAPRLLPTSMAPPAVGAAASPPVATAAASGPEPPAPGGEGVVTRHRATRRGAVGKHAPAGDPRAPDAAPDADADATREGALALADLGRGLLPTPLAGADRGGAGAPGGGAPRHQQFVYAFQEALRQGRVPMPDGEFLAPRSAAQLAARSAALARFREKRKNRTFQKKVRYESRKKLAEQRPRIRGQFVKQEVAAALAAVELASGK